MVFKIIHGNNLATVGQFRQNAKAAFELVEQLRAEGRSILKVIGCGGDTLTLEQLEKLSREETQSR